MVESSAVETTSVPQQQTEDSFSQKHFSIMSYVNVVPDSLHGLEHMQRLIHQNKVLLAHEQNKDSKVNEVTLPAHKLYKPLVVVGPSGAGKGTLLTPLLGVWEDKFGFSVSYTTRAPREGEVDGKHYNFVTQEVFKKMIANDDFIEWCEVHTNMYGTSKSYIQKIQQENKIPVLDIDVQGALKFQKVFPDSNYIFILPPSIAALRERLVKRGTETEKSLETRLTNAGHEITECFQKPDIFNYRLVNEDLNVSKATFELLIMGLYLKEIAQKDDKFSVATNVESTKEKPKKLVRHATFNENVEVIPEREEEADMAGKLKTIGKIVGVMAALVLFHEVVLVRKGKAL